MAIPFIVIAAVAVGGSSLMSGWGIRQAGEGLEKAGDGTMKMAFGGAVLMGTWLYWKRRRKRGG